ncbi:MAG TPA: V-type ATP synthase subunit F [Patescibacteria group bacterium]|nr:V-type ATP synthase subunit F [Patescibacteria group bacterium]
MTFFCIADKDSSLGFRLAGIETREALTRPEAEEALRLALATQDVGVILITTKVARFVKEQIEKRTYAQQMPLILEIPSRGETSKPYSAGDFLKRAIGIDI